jgi:acetyl esterase/lipase
MDLYYPADGSDPARTAQNAGGPFPLVVLIHGGGFTMCDKRDWHLYPGFFALEAGFALASVNYRLAPGDPFPAAVEDIKDAVGFLRKNANEYGLDPSNFFLYGTSAGGNLAAYAGLDGGESKGTERDYHVNAAAVLCGLINFNDFYKEAALFMKLLLFATGSSRKNYLACKKKELPERGWLASADSRIDCAAGDAAFYIQHGQKDPAVPVSQSVNFYNKLKARFDMGADDLVLDIMPSAAHAGGGPEYLEREHIMPIFEFFGRHLKGGA